MIRGSAVPTTVWSRAPRKTPTMTAPRTRIRTGWGSSIGGRSAGPKAACVASWDTGAPHSSFGLMPGPYRLIRSISFLMAC